METHSPLGFSLGCLLVFSSLGFVKAWHGFNNFRFHCWPLTASEAQQTPLDDDACDDAFKVKWVFPPPDEMRAQENFSVTYNLEVKPNFYKWAVDNGYFDGVGPGDLTTEAQAKTWCETTPCPTGVTVKKTHCCIHHVNVHSCPKAEQGLCGPWLKHDGSTYTHSAVIVGPVDQGNWTSTIPGIAQDGLTDLIAHFKIANMQLALQATIRVLPRTVCGDGKCETTEGEDCEVCPKDCGRCPLKAWEIALIAVAGVVFIGTIAGIYGYFAWQRRKLLWDEKWIIPFEDIKLDEGLRGAFGSMIGSGLDIDKKQSAGGVSVMQTGGKQVFAQLATYDGRSCAVRPVAKQEFTLTKKIRLEVREIRECDNANLCKFVGACIEVPNMCILNEYCPKGSLLDVVLNEEVPLNWAFRFSFEGDIARGMAYLHSRKIIHGRLTSSNCVVDDRWTVKISDYGLNLLRANVLVDPLAQEELAFKNRRTRIYMAPEFAAADPYNYDATMAGDVYAFAIIMIEIAIRNDPYGDEDCFSLPPTWKPPLPNFDPEMFENKDDICPCPEQYIQLIEACWEDDPAQRPTYNHIRATVKKINPSKLSAVDLMMAMMEKYSRHLETIVGERTADLVAEKAKTDRLLYSMLPKAVADDLRQGKSIDAKFHDICTIYFSDIVGFTTISGRSAPIQVVGLLNKLYVTFDDIIDKYDVYKVETIGDAYMVVSGIPIFTEHHASEVAKMSIDLVIACESFVIPHMPDEPLKIRVGLHTGPACAGVVGIKMPRYCLFGDTVNTASRMESNSEAYKIHISNPCYEQLVRYENVFDMEKRGTIAVKGKGDMLTWWLNGYMPTYKEGKKSRDGSGQGSQVIAVRESQTRQDNA
ncbi:atrial natriuretic peptide receptor 1-like [Mercenaria mercenaria]|uniref:atrial natriuretic peptide receptor 1-like n=1 Tax=Mercenaria mercenaria TaxID=6596 RepID=UPI001E1D7535|nr:atrial natriuretic peptide receptor 1-like [Mercenaria mercenaria]